jgi:hypothetical protein
VPEENVYKRKVSQIVYYKNEDIQFVYNQIDEHAFAYPHSPAVQSKNQTSGYIDTYLIILFVAIDTSSIIFVSLCKKNHSSDLESSCPDPKKMGMAHNCNPFLANPLNTPVILYPFHAQDKNK